MTIVDRYVLRLYAKVFVVCFVSLTGLYVVIETLNNLDEFLVLGKSQGGLVAVLLEYFVARAFTFFDRTSHLLALMSAIFTLTWMQRCNETASILAAGIPQWRLVKPVLAASIVISLMGVANREVLIPQYRAHLVRDAQTWSGDAPQPMQPRVDYTTDFFISGDTVIPSKQVINSPSVHLDRSYPGWGSRVLADNAEFRESSGHHPAGYLCINVTKPRQLAHTRSVYYDGKALLLSPSDQPWLEENQCFVASGLSFEQLVNGDELLHFASTWELVQNIRNPSQDYGAGLRVTTHARVLRPILDIALLLIGLPIVVSRKDRNLFVAAGLCVLLIAVFSITSMVCHGLATFGAVAPYVGAWAPVATFVPPALVALGSMNH